MKSRYNSSRILIILIIAITINISCYKKPPKLLDLIKTELNIKSSHSIKDLDIIFAFDDDCASCYYEFLNLNKRNTELIGIFDSQYPNLFRKKMEKIYIKTKWLKLENKSIVNILRKNSDKKHGPYFLKIRNDKVSFVY